MSIAIVSSLYGDYDQPAVPVPQDIDCEYILVTDRHYDADPWKVVVEPRPQLHPRLAAKVAKCRPDLYADADVILWVDASVQILDAHFAAAVVEQMGAAPLAQIRHPARSSIVDEANVSQQMEKYTGLPVVEQARHYVATGYPDGWGMWATGLIARRRDGWPLQAVGDAWLREQMRWTYQDQISEPPVLYSYGITPADLGGPLYGNPRFLIREHRDHR